VAQSPAHRRIVEGARLDYLIVGAGLTGSVIARILADHGQDVAIFERRPHLGGNVHDYTHESGIPVHTYGPHFFRTSSERVWNFVRRFGAFRPYTHRLLTQVDGRFEPWPLTASALQRLGVQPVPQPSSARPRSFEEACLAKMPRVVYERFVRGYTEKQWGVPAHRLAPGLARRIEVRSNEDDRLKRSRYQGFPIEGYSSLMRKMVEGIPVRTGVDYLEVRGEVRPRRLVVYTGPIDAWFGHDLGRLAYRGQQREHEYRPDVDRVLPGPVVNDPGPAEHVRTIEWKQLMTPEDASRVRGTLLTREIPWSPSDPDGFEYPFQDSENRTLYRRYGARADATPGLLICGRLGEYRYYDMDQAIARAMKLASGLLRDQAVTRIRLGASDPGSGR
jgi:UDP-galactopyranose mutase